MKLNRLIASLMTTAFLVGQIPAVAVPLPGSAGSATSAFQDISDPVVADAAEILRLLGVVSGTGGGFHPSGSLTRAEFCKMTVEIMGKGAQEPANRGRTIFRDVGPTHWARGYINLAASTPLGGGSSSGGTGSDKEGTTTPSERLITGVGNGNFEPESKINFGSAVAILTRVLGYTSTDVSIGSNWYDGYLAVAKQSGLADGISLDGDAPISRGQAALLFKNLLFTKSKGSEIIYLNTLGGKVTENILLLSTTATAADGSTHALQTPDNLYRTDRGDFSTSLHGVRGKLVLDKNEKVLAFQPDKNDTIRRVSVMGSAQANHVIITGDTKLDTTLETVVWKDGKATTYEKIWTTLRTGTPLVFCYNAAGKLDYIYMPGESATADVSAMVARNKPTGTLNPFSALAGGATDYILYKNGVLAKVEDIRQYDVATYDKDSKIMYVSDLRLTGLYENAYPNISAPSTITVMGVTLPVLPSATVDLSAFKVGETATFLLTSAGQIAGAVTTTAAHSTAVGTAEITGTDAKVTLFSGLVVQGGTGLTPDSASKYQGQLVTVSSYKAGQISLSRLSSNGVHGSLDVEKKLLNGTPLAENIKLFERVGNSRAGEIEYSQITCDTVPAEKILYAEKDYAGKINLLVLDDVTGDQYIYGYLKSDLTPAPSLGGEASYNNVTSVKSDGKTAKDGWKNTSTELVGGNGGFDNTPGGLAISLDTAEGGTHKIAGMVTLQKLTGVSRSSFDMDAKMVTTTDIILPISSHVVCFNENTNNWFLAEDPMDALNEARAFSNTLTVYYDKAPEEGGKIRLIVAEKLT